MLFASAILWIYAAALKGLGFIVNVRVVGVELIGVHIEEAGFWSLGPSAQHILNMLSLVTKYVLLAQLLTVKAATERM